MLVKSNVPPVTVIFLLCSVQLNVFSKVLTPIISTTPPSATLESAYEKLANG